MDAEEAKMFEMMDAALETELAGTGLTLDDVADVFQDMAEIGFGSGSADDDINPIS